MGNKANEDVESEREDFDADHDEEEEDGYENENDDYEDGDMENEDINNVNGVEDRFLKINELEEYLEEDEAREYGLKKEKKDNKRKRVELMDADEDEDEEDEEGDRGVDEDEDEGDDEELELLELADDGDNGDDENKLRNARYEDFFGGKGIGQKKSSTLVCRSPIWVMKIGRNKIFLPMKKSKIISVHILKTWRKKT